MKNENCKEGQKEEKKEKRKQTNGLKIKKKRLNKYLFGGRRRKD